MESSKAKDNNVDSWYGVQDPRKRKQIQDRLAQRARRKRLLEAGKDSEQSLALRRPSDENPGSDAITEGKVDTGPSDMTRAIVNTSSCSVSSSSPSSTSGTNDSALAMLLSAVSLSPRVPCVQRLPPDSKMRVIVALEVNRSMLGMSCSGTTMVKSPPQPISVPQILHPTQLQLTTPHYNWIDPLPFPRMRDNVIFLSKVCDVDELFRDFFATRSFSVKEGALAWDPQAWQISPEFEAKWGYLFY